MFSCKFFHIFLVNSSFPSATPSHLRGPSRRSLTNGAWRKRPSACAPRRRKPQVPLEDGADGDALTPFFFGVFFVFFLARIDFQVLRMMMMVIWWWLFGSLASFFWLRRSQSSWLLWSNLGFLARSTFIIQGGESWTWAKDAECQPCISDHWYE